MDTHKLKVLLAAVDSGSLNKAAERLGYTQPAIVHAINSLEKELGVKIIERSHKGVALTTEGAQLYPDILKMVALDDDIAVRAAAINKAARQYLLIEALPSVARHILSKPISIFQKNYPEATIDLQLVNGPVRPFSSSNDVDLVLTDIRFCENVPHRVIMSDPMMAVVPSAWDIAAAQNVSVEDLCNYKILFPPDTAMSSALLFLKERAPDQMTISTIGSDILISLVEQEVGVTVISHLSTEHLPASVRCVPIRPELSRSLCICARDFDSLTQIQRNFLSILYEYLITFAAGLSERATEQPPLPSVSS
ncbi:MAG: LysR family transcriptional regulator [Lachnospiraceae bacterium]|nr:LysR family transcriptional regulator [Lachnospiraceae bacterium]